MGKECPKVTRRQWSYFHSFMVGQKLISKNVFRVITSITVNSTKWPNYGTYKPEAWKLLLFVCQVYFFRKMSVNILPSLNIIKWLLNIKQPKHFFVWIKIPKSPTFPSLSPGGHFLCRRMWRVLYHLLRACKHVLYGFWAPTYLVPPYRKWVQGEGTETQ